jgi:N-acetylglucosamine malate deacetylase 1
MSISRREILGTAAAAAPLAFPDPLSQSSEPQKKLRIVVTGGHPGDPEYGCGGTVARLTDIGHDVVLFYLNKGQKGIPRKPPEEAGAIRVAEAGKASAILKATPLFASHMDGSAVIDDQHYDEFHQALAARNPDAVFTQWPLDNHPDHRATFMLVYGAWERMQRSFALYYYEVSNGEDTVQFAPTQYVDITQTVERKRLACYAHASQAPDKFYKLQEQVAIFRGFESGHQQAEAFVRHVQGPDFRLPG